MRVTESFSKSSVNKKKIYNSSLDCIFKKNRVNSNTCTTTRLTPLCFQMKKRRFFVFGHKHFAEATQGHYGFHNGDLVEQKPVNIDQRAKTAYKFPI